MKPVCISALINFANSASWVGYSFTKPSHPPVHPVKYHRAELAQLAPTCSYKQTKLATVLVLARCHSIIFLYSHVLIVTVSLCPPYAGRSLFLPQQSLFWVWTESFTLTILFLSHKTFIQLDQTYTLQNIFRTNHLHIPDLADMTDFHLHLTSSDSWLQESLIFFISWTLT